VIENRIDARRLTFENLDTLWSGGNPLVLPVSGSPWCEIRLNPAANTLSLRTEYQSPEPDLGAMENVSFEVWTSDGRDVAELAVRVGHNIHSAYGLIASIADEIQIVRNSLAAAISTGIRGYRDILATRVLLSTQAEVGLVGELLFLEFLIDKLGPEKAVDSWKGPLSEEHDFVFPEVHVEVKTTVSERRQHVINGLDQLLPVMSTPLRLLSIQVTRAPATVGCTLPALISRVREKSLVHAKAIDRRLREAFHWDDDDANLYPTAWMLRHHPRAYAVESDFPAMTSQAIEQVVPQSGLLSEVSYKVDVTGLTPVAPSGILAGFLETGRGE
jgi:hypothetical protein